MSCFRPFYSDINNHVCSRLQCIFYVLLTIANKNICRPAVPNVKRQRGLNKAVDSLFLAILYSPIKTLLVHVIVSANTDEFIRMSLLSSKHCFYAIHLIQFF